MRIIFLSPGSGGQFYCENCIRDAGLLRGLRAAGTDALSIPMYLPAGIEHAGVVQSPIFFGGINVYLQQKFGLFRKTPRWLDALLDSQSLLAKISRHAGMTNAKELGETTLSMLAGREGRQVKELDRLMGWLLLPENRPDIVIFSNALLIGLAAEVKRRLGCKTLCLLQDEDGFVDGLGKPWTKQVWDLIGQRAADIDLFVAVSGYYRDAMCRRLGLAAEQIEVVYGGLDLSQYAAGAARQAGAIGFLSRMCYDNGLDILIEATGILHRQRTADIRLILCGGQTSADEQFISGVKRRVVELGLSGRVEFRQDFAPEARRKFLQDISILCVPHRHPVAYGLSVLEAMAAGIAFAAPRQGVFEEYLRMSKGGVLYTPNNAQSLAEVLRPLVSDAAYAAALGQHGRNAADAHFQLQTNVLNLLTIIRRVVG